ncbi:hypothetical protein Y045_6117 [Burkholderia pseudomallei MSHR2451]|nr:hypothetical protein Y045_6117 [Burkholderia pseudomallei MSHR2451]
MAETRELLIGPRELEFVVHVLTSLSECHGMLDVGS